MNEASIEDSEDLRKALQHAVNKIIFAEDRIHNTRTSVSALDALTELTFQYATKSLIPDLYAFSTHANRKSTIVPDDVAMVLRKLPLDQLEEFKSSFCSSSSSSGGGGKVTATNKNSLKSNSNSNGKIHSKTKPITKTKSITAAVGRRRKRNDELSLSPSSSSDDEYSSSGGMLSCSKPSSTAL